MQQIIPNTCARIADGATRRRRMAQHGTYSGADPLRALSHAVTTTLPAVSPAVEGPGFAPTTNALGPTGSSYGMLLISNLDSSADVSPKRSRAALPPWPPAAQPHDAARAHCAARRAGRATSPTTIAGWTRGDASWLLCAISAQQDAAVMILRETDEKNGTDDRVDCVD